MAYYRSLPSSLESNTSYTIPYLFEEIKKLFCSLYTNNCLSFYW